MSKRTVDDQEYDLPALSDTLQRKYETPSVENKTGLEYGVAGVHVLVKSAQHSVDATPETTSEDDTATSGLNRTQFEVELSLPVGSVLSI